MRRFFELLMRFDWIFLVAVLTLTSLGLVAIYGIDVSREHIELFTFYKQFAAALAGLALVIGMIFVDFRLLRAYSFILYLGGAALLLLVVFFGHTVNGTQGWFKIGSLSFQPVEFAKISLIIYLASLFERLGHGRLTWRLFILSGAATAFYMVLILLQPDFGSAAVLAMVWLLLTLFAGWPRRAWYILPLIAVLASVLIWNFGLQPYQRDRFTTFLHPEIDSRGSNYNALQARIAIGSGGWFGKGISEGSQARLRFLPEAATDFLIAVLGEELGFAGLALILGLYLLVFYRQSRLAAEADDDFASLLIIGLSAVFLVHLVVNVGMSMGIMPITGIPLPFISAAASSLISAYLVIGIIESVAVRRGVSRTIDEDALAYPS